MTPSVHERLASIETKLDFMATTTIAIIDNGYLFIQKKCSIVQQGPHRARVGMNERALR